MENEPKVVNLLLKTWPNDIGGIFDYSTKSVQTVKNIIVESTYVVRDKNNNSIENKQQHSSIQMNNEDLLFHVLIDINNKYSLYNPIPRRYKLNNENISDLNNKIWYVIKSEDENDGEDCNEDYSLSENDIIKFGKVKFAVKKIHFENENDDPAKPMGDPKNYNISELNKNCPPVFDVFNVNPEKINDDAKCYICQNQDNVEDENKKADINNNNKDDTLIYLCNCKNRKYFHLSCLINKLNIKRDGNKPIDYSITIDNFECPNENCHQPYPLQYKITDKENVNEIKYTIDYKDYEPKFGDYMILESLDKKRNNEYCKSIHIIKLNKLNNEYITLGREGDNDIVDDDISISRNHAIFCYNKNEGKIYLKNKSKKFGSQVLIKKGFNLLDKKIHLQVGRTYIEAYRGIKEINNE